MRRKDIRTAVPTIYGDYLQRFGALWKSQIEKLSETFGSAIESHRMPGTDCVDVPVVQVAKNSILDVLKFCKSEAQFKYEFLSDMTATDEHPEQPRFRLVYNLFSPEKFVRIRIKTSVNEKETAPTAIPLWQTANWAEREVYDMFGIRFEGHPDMRRILMDDRWQGYPLRKDYPLRGYQIFPTPQAIQPRLLGEPEKGGASGSS